MDLQKLIEFVTLHYKKDMDEFYRQRESPIQNYYTYIPTYDDVLLRIIKRIMQDIPIFHGLRFMDIGCGVPVIPKVMDILGCSVSCGLEFNKEYLDRFPYDLVEGDMLKYNFGCYDILYTYNPIIDPELMVNALENIIKTMKSGAILYYNCSAWDLDRNTLNKFERIENVGTKLYRYKKPY